MSTLTKVYQQLQKLCAEVVYEKLPEHLLATTSAAFCCTTALKLLLWKPEALRSVTMQLCRQVPLPQLLQEHVSQIQLDICLKMHRGLLPSVLLWPHGPTLESPGQADWTGSKLLRIHPIVWPLLQAVLLSKEPEWYGTFTRRPRGLVLWKLGPAAQSWLKDQTPRYRERLAQLLHFL